MLRPASSHELPVGDLTNTGSYPGELAYSPNKELAEKAVLTLTSANNVPIVRFTSIADEEPVRLTAVRSKGVHKLPTLNAERR